MRIAPTPHRKPVMKDGIGDRFMALKRAAEGAPRRKKTAPKGGSTQLEEAVGPIT
jgi:hypothetical protein